MTTKLNPYGEPWRPSKGRIDPPAGIPNGPWKFKGDADFRVFFWIEGRTWQKPPTFRDWAHEFAFRCGKMAATNKVWMGRGLVDGITRHPPTEPEKVAPAPIGKIERQGFEGCVSDRLPDAFRTSMQSIFSTDETIDGANVNETAAAVLLDVAFGPVLPNPVNSEGSGWPRCMVTGGIPIPSGVLKMPDGTYALGCRGTFETMPVSERALKVMRARYLLVHGWYWRHLRAMSHSEREEVLARFFPGGAWTPKEGSALTRVLGVV